ncbi:hypothetical protein F444_03723 [Phytophthora nicotianae P1976]|uniref:Endonuclease/exonuclease/phosphatase domain-containing protein n=1 Tax=Phytophthora nicotianae P1976 TaxID=1317066 RepID=A0A081AT42_PHYNI|nr:hypothetical protein F444_03723 [Phytophthora nicotianae P1976]
MDIYASLPTPTDTAMADNAAPDVDSMHPEQSVLHAPVDELEMPAKTHLGPARQSPHCGKTDGESFTGRFLTFESLNPLSDAFYLDILGVRSDAVASRLFTSFLEYGCQPIYFNFTYRDPVSTITSGIVRYYFNSSTCPTTLVINGQVCDQVNFGGMLYSVRARGAQATQYHLTPSKLSQHCLEFSLPTHNAQDGGADAPAPRGEKRCRSATESSGSASVISECMVSTSKVITTDSHADKSDSMGRAGESIVELSPSSAFASPPRKRLARRQSTGPVSQPPAFTSTTYWEELDKFSFELSAQTLTVGEEDDSLRVTVQPISSPESSSTSTELTHLTEVRKGKQSLLERELAEPIASEDLVPSRAEERAVTTDDLRRSMSRSNILFLGKLFRLTRTKIPLLNDFIRLHLISRSVAAGSCASIAEKWALALFELLVMAVAPGIYANDEWLHLICGFSSPYIGGASTRLLHPNALLGLLRSQVGHRIMSHMECMALNDPSVDRIRALQAASEWLPWETSVLRLAETQLGTAWAAGSIPMVSSQVVTRNGRKFIEKVIFQYHIIGVQETKFRDVHHLSSASDHCLFVSDRNSSSPVQVGPRSGGVATLLHPDLPGVGSAEEVRQTTIPGRYLLIRLVHAGSTVYIHNIYVPVNASEHSHFYQSLPAEFDQDCHHLVLGEFNVAIDPILDSRGVSSVSDTPRGYLLSWLSTLNVANAWRLRFSSRRVFSGPSPRINRLDYIFISDDWVDSTFDEARYFQLPHSGDHLAVRVALGSPSRRPLSAYWRLNPSTLQDDAVRQIIILDIRQLQQSIRHTPSPGLVWEGWKRRIKSLLQLAQVKAGAQETDILRVYRSHVT